jgi:hypothetical protein
MTDAAVTNASSELVARADFQYRWRVYLFFVVMFGYGMWSLYDGFVAWPRDNAQWKQMEERGQMPPQKMHNDAGILLNRILGIVLPSISLPLFIWLMYRSRGEYRLANNTLQAPGHSPIPLDRVEALDKTRWDRKGIAAVEYKDNAGVTRNLILRDMVYQRNATDQIIDRIEAHLASGDQPTAPSGPQT